MNSHPKYCLPKPPSVSLNNLKVTPNTPKICYAMEQNPQCYGHPLSMKTTSEPTGIRKEQIAGGGLTFTRGKVRARYQLSNSVPTNRQRSRHNWSRLLTVS